jgi:hypothetical protein
MNLTIEIPDEVGTTLKAQAQEHGLTAASYASRMIEQTLAVATMQEDPSRPFETGYGMWAKYGPAPSAEDIDENRREMFQSFAGEKSR